MRGDFICSDDDLLQCDLAVVDTWLFEPERMLLSTSLSGCPLQVDLTKLIEGDVDLERSIQALICSRMTAAGVVESFSLTLINGNRPRGIESTEMNWDIGIAMTSMNFKEIGRSIIIVVSSLLEEHSQTFEALLGADRHAEPEEDLMFPQIDDFDMRLENILKDILTS